MSEMRERFIGVLAADATAEELDLMIEAAESRAPICVGTWGADGVKQSYTCLMGTVAVMQEVCTISDLVEGGTYVLSEALGESVEDDEFEGESYTTDYPRRWDNIIDVFDGYFGTGYGAGFTRNEARAASTFGEEIQVLNPAGREELASIAKAAKARQAIAA